MKTIIRRSASHCRSDDRRQDAFGTGPRTILNGFVAAGVRK